MENINPKISVIVPVYKAEKYLRKCVDSLLMQTFHDFEILLIDDGSPDKSGEICDNYSMNNSNVRTFHIPNSGVSIARNLGIEKAEAEWICFVDSDDWVEETYLSNFLQEELHENQIVLQSILLDFEYAPERNTSFIKYNNCICKFPFASIIENQRVLHDGYPYAKLYNKNILQKHSIRFPLNLSTHEDHVFVWTYLSYVKEIRLCSNLSYHYMRRGNETLSTKYHSSEEYILASDNLLQKLFILQVLFKLEGSHYLKEVYSDYGLLQLLRACRNANDTNFIEIYRYTRTKKKLFDIFYISHSLQEQAFVYCLLYKIFSDKQLYKLTKFLTKR